MATRLRVMPRETLPTQPLRRHSYRDVLLGRHPGYRWAAWHRTVGWMDAGATLAEAKCFVDWSLNPPHPVDSLPGSR